MEIVSLCDRRKIDQKSIEGESKHDILTSDGTKMLFEFGPCRSPKCLGNIKYKIKQNVPEEILQSPFSGMINEYHTAIDFCVNRGWKKPWEYLLSPKDLVLKRISEVKKHVHRIDRTQVDAKTLGNQLES